MATTETAAHVYGRDAQPTPEVLEVDVFPYSTLMGDWLIVGSSLPLWKNRTDVLCRYTPIDVPSPQTQAAFHASPDASAEAVPAAKGAKGRVALAARKSLRFSDEIWWEQLDKSGKHQPGKGAPRSKRSIVRGKNRVDPKGTNAATFLWRGFNFLKPFTSHWQILAHSDNFVHPSDGEVAGAEPIWLVTYFTATIFTEAGIDLYVRGTLDDAAYDDIVEKLKAFQGTGEGDAKAKELRQLAAKLFKVPTGNV